MEQIVRHILGNFMVIPSAFVNFDLSKSLMSKDFILSEKLSFEMDDGSVIKNNVWGCQISVEQQDLKVLLGDCSQNKECREYCLTTQIKNGPIYGLYLINQSENNEAMIACSLNGKDWMECQTYLQATFLAGMEQIRDMGTFWSKCSSYKDQFDALLSFIKFHDAIYEAKYER
jgi:hypothetical protein